MFELLNSPMSTSVVARAVPGIAEKSSTAAAATGRSPARTLAATITVATTTAARLESNRITLSPKVNGQIVDRS
jgi:hypothetical protein